MKGALLLLIVLFVTSSCSAQNASTDKNELSKTIFQNQIAYYADSIKNKDDYQSIINFAKNERSEILKGLNKKLSDSDSFKILEGWNHWGQFVGVIWNRKFAFYYTKSPKNGDTIINKIKLDANFEKKTGIGLYILNSIDAWNLKYINQKKRQLGAKVLDGYFFIATKVTYRERQPTRIETIAFEQFVRD